MISYHLNHQPTCAATTIPKLEHWQGQLHPIIDQRD